MIKVIIIFITINTIIVVGEPSLFLDFSCGCTVHWVRTEGPRRVGIVQGERLRWLVMVVATVVTVLVIVMPVVRIVRRG